jgi:N-acetylmuramoyl-L-alanine amidase
VSPSRVAAATPTASASPSSSPSQADGKPLAGRMIVIDPGHNGGWTAKFGYRKVPDGNGHHKACNSSGTATNSGYAEHAYNWAQANALAEVLRARGATVHLTRSSDTGQGPCVNKRASLANTLPADLLISIHADGNLGKGHRGFHVIISPVMHGGKAVYAKSRKLAVDVRADVQQEAGMPRSNYIGKGTAFSIRSDLGTLNFAQVPAVMMEMGNMRNAKDAKLFRSPAWRAKAATALADGITTFLG